MSTGVKSNAVPSAGQHVDGPRLLGEIGDTNARFALETGPGEIFQVQEYPCADYPGIAEVIRKYLKDMQIGRVNHGAIAIANPLDDDRISMTNPGWTFSIEATRRALGFGTLRVVNDFTALAMALPGLTDSQRVQVGGGARRPNSVIGLLNPGTGLGVGGLIPAADRWIALDSEGGHTTFAPADEREDLVLQYARNKWSHVSFERVSAGSGIEVIYRALAARDKKCVTFDTSDVVKRALDGEPLAAESVEVFCSILGTFAGNIAVTLGSLGGIYIGGGVVPRLGEFLERSSFRERFEAKGRFESYLKNVPTYVITAEYPALLGVSAILAEQLSNRAGGNSTAVFERIRQMRDALTSAERRVADLALNHPRSIINDPITDIARKAEVGTSTVIRFCRSLGWPRLSDLKLKLATGLTGTIPVSHSQVHPGDMATDFGAKVLDNTISAILQLREHLNFEHVERAIELLNDARRIEFYGLGNSNVIVQDAHYKFFRFGIPTIAYGDPYMQAASAALLGVGDVIVAVSRSGCAPELLRVLDVAMQAGAQVIAITSSNTPLAKRATVALGKDHIEIRESQLSMISRILHLVMIDILAVGVAIRRAVPGEDVAEAIARLRGSADDDVTAALDWLSHGGAGAATGSRKKSVLQNGVKQDVGLERAWPTHRAP